MNDARLIKPIPKRRLRLIKGDPSTPPIVGDLGETDQWYAGFWGSMVLVYFRSADGTTEWEAQACESELELVEEATDQTLQRTGAARKRSWLQRLFSRGPGR
jgi:hypothetical protein